MIDHATQAINNRPNLTQKMALLIPNLDSFDLDLALPESTEHEQRDVITKQHLSPLSHHDVMIPRTKVCFQCGEKTRSPWGNHGIWAAWERNWQRRCVCGGWWVVEPVTSNFQFAV